MNVSTRPVPEDATPAPAPLQPKPPAAAPVVQDDGPDIRTMLLPIWQRKWLVAICMILATALGAAAAVYMDNRYTATARVIFEPERLRIIDLDNVIVSPDVSTTGLQNQIEILRSAILLERVIETLRLERTPEFNPDLRTDQPGVVGRAVDALPIPGIVREQLARIGVLPPAVPEGMTPEQLAEQLRASTLTTLMENMRLRPVPNSRVIEISYTSTNPRLAAAIVNATGEQYIVVQTERKRDDIATASELLSVRVRDLENRLNTAEEAVRMAELELSMGAEFGSALIARQLEVLNTSLAEARMQRTAVEGRYLRASRAIEQGNDLQVVPDFRDSAAIRSYRAREVELLDQEASLRAIVSAGTNPTLLRLEARLTEVRRSIEQEAQGILAALASDVEAATANEETLMAELSELEARALEQSRAEMRLARLEREAQASRLIYDNFLNRMNETNEQAALQSPDARFLTRATTPQSPDNGVRQVLVLIAAFVGIAGGIGIVYGLERLNDSFRSPRDLEKRTGLPVLAGIPQIGRRKGPKDLLMQLLDKPSGPLAESTRNLRTSILFSNIDHAPKVIMFASSVPTEGKTTTAMLTAITSQQMERSAVIVDCDLRRRTMGSIFPDKGDQPGLFAALQGTSSIEEAVYVEPETGLHVLTPERAAHGLGNPADILASRRFQRLVAQLKARYDLVILDTPPTLAVTDSRIVAQSADAVVYLVRWNHARRSVVLEALRELRSVNARIAGVALTMVDERQAGTYVGNGYLSKGTYGTYQTA